jgi:hypothetical protein
MANHEQPPTPFQASGELAEMAEEAIAVFQEKNPEKFDEMVRTFAGQSVDCALVGHGRFNVSVVEEGRVHIEPNVVRGGPATARAAIYPETLVAITEGKMTAWEAYSKGDLIVRSESGLLYEFYGYYLELGDTFLRSGRLQEVLGRFRERFRV